MCLAVPGSIVSLAPNNRALVDMLGAQREVSIRLTPDANVGDYVLVHAGFAIQVIDEQEAAETLRLVEDLADFVDADLGSTSSESAAAPSTSQAQPSNLQ